MALVLGTHLYHAETLPNLALATFVRLECRKVILFTYRSLETSDQATPN